MVGDCECSDHGRCTILTQDQWDLVRRLRLEALRDSPHAFLGDLAQESSRSEIGWRRTFESASWHAGFVAEDPVAIARSVSYPALRDERYVESLWVREKNRHDHIVRLLLDSIVTEALAEGREFLRLSVLRSNAEAVDTMGHLGFSASVPDRTTDLEICLEWRIAT